MLFAHIPKMPNHAVAGVLLVALASLTPLPVQARESLGVYADWGAFRDPLIPRCYAITKAQPSNLRRDYEPFAAIGTWPKRGVRNHLHFRLSRKLAPTSKITLKIGGNSFILTGGGGDAWPVDAKMNAAITAAMRSAKQMIVSASDTKGKRFANIWELEGAASAMDAATLSCAKLR